VVKKKRSSEREGFLRKFRSEDENTGSAGATMHKREESITVPIWGMGLESEEDEGCEKTFCVRR